MNPENGARPRTALVAYGSETGNALDYAEELGRTLERLHFSTQPSLSSFSFSLFVTSTTGQGDLPSNAQSFWNFLLRKKLPSTFLQGVNVVTFGLGDSSYPRYNLGIRKLHKRLLQLGAVEIYPRGEADEQHEEGSDAAFVPWVIDLRRKLLDRFPLPKDTNPVPDDVLLPPKWLLFFLEASEKKQPALSVSHDHNIGDTNGDTTLATQSSVINTVSATEKSSVAVEVSVNKRLTPSNHWQDVRHLIFTSQSSVIYEPGDVLTIHPQNASESVDEIVRLMGWEGAIKKLVSFKASESQSTSFLTPSPPFQKMPGESCTFQELLLNHLDLTAIPRRSFFAMASHFTENQYQKDRLLEFTRPEYIDELYDYTARPRRSILEVLQEFDSVKIPWQWAAAVLPELRGRQFSIAGGGQLKTDNAGHTSFELLVAIVKYKTVIKKIREGVCTRYLANLSPGSHLQVSLQKGGLGLKTINLTKPLVLIGPGTGVAPIRSIIWERLQLAESQSRAEDSEHLALEVSGVGKMLLIFGCRSEAADFFFRDEWASIRNKLPLEVQAAFSRDQVHKVYVQDVVRAQRSEIFRLLHDLEGTVFVCGSSGKMPAAVRVALTDVFQSCSAMNEEQAQGYLAQMERSGRYKQETWG